MRVLAATKIPLYTYLYFGQDSNIRNYACNITVIRLSDKRNSKKLFLEFLLCDIPGKAAFVSKQENVYCDSEMMCG